MRKPRGKTKLIPIEAVRLARDIQRLKRLDACGRRLKKNRELVQWARTSINERLWEAAANVEALNDVSRALRNEESKAERVIRAYWSIWNVEGLSWGERALEMSKLGFDEFKDVPLSTFKSMCRRRLKLELRPSREALEALRHQKVLQRLTSERSEFLNRKE
jgi:hypothetical protein